MRRNLTHIIQWSVKERKSKQASKQTNKMKYHLFYDTGLSAFVLTWTWTIWLVLLDIDLHQMIVTTLSLRDLYCTNWLLTCFDYKYQVTSRVMAWLGIAPNCDLTLTCNKWLITWTCTNWLVHTAYMHTACYLQ